MKKQLALATVLAAALAAGSVHAQSAGQATEAQSSESIRMMQQALQNEGYQLQVDGIWGPNTQQALNQFQERQQQMGMSGQTAATPESPPSASGSTLGSSGAGMGTATSPGLSGTGTSGAGIDSSPTGTVDTPQTAEERGWDRSGGIDAGSDRNLGTGAGETGVGGAGGAGGAGSGGAGR
ncbi:MAG: peptidoglycan-binding domain-containing protein [Rhodospirillaceae bacterium]